MKNIIKIAFVMVVVMVFAGCGKNPLISSYSSTSGGGSGAGSVGASMSVTTAQLSVSMLPNMFTAVTPTAYNAGWVTYAWGAYLKVACYNSSGVLIAPATLEEWDTVATANTKTIVVIAEKMGAVVNLTFTLNVLGNLDLSGGMTMTGTLKYTENGKTFTCTYSNFSMTGAGVFSGTAAAVMGSWSTAITFNANGSADGTITGPEYTATIHVNQDGTGSYTDSLGPHTLFSIL